MTDALKFMTLAAVNLAEYLWIDATYVKTREARGIVSMALIIAVGVNTEGQRDVLGMKVGALEAEPF